MTDQEPIVTKEDPNSAKQEYHNYIFTCIGHVWYRPRIMSRRVTQNLVQPYIQFNLKFKEFAKVDPDSAEFLYLKMEDRVRSQIETSKIYTDLDGVIQDFIIPTGAWWIEVETLSWVRAPLTLPEMPKHPSNPITLDNDTGNVVYGV